MQCYHRPLKRLIYPVFFCSKQDSWTLIICSVFPGIHDSIRAMNYIPEILEKQPLSMHRLPVRYLNCRSSDPRPTGHTIDGPRTLKAVVV